MKVHRPKLWKQSQITYNYVSPQLSFSNQKRFKLHSIYWPQKQSIVNARLIKNKTNTQEIAMKVSKLIDQEQKNQQRMNKSQRSSLNKIKVQPHKVSKPTISLRQTSTSQMSRQNKQIVQRLSIYSQKPLSKLRDRHGFRNPLPQENPQIQQQRVQTARDMKNQSSSVGFRTSRRVDLNLPQNFYPGPGTYQIKRYLDGLHKNRIPGVVVNSLKTEK